MSWPLVRLQCVIVKFPGHTCDFARTKSKSPHCKYHQQGSAVSYQNKCFTTVILLNPGPNPIEHICDEIAKNFVIICVCIMYICTLLYMLKIDTG